MAEIAEQEVVDTTQEAQTPDISTQLQGAFWGEPQPAVTQDEPKEEPKQEEKKEEPPAVVNEWWKSFEWDNEDVAKAEIQKLKQVKPQDELKFANDESRKLFEYAKEGKLDEAYELWGKQKQISKLLDGEITESKAAEIIKFNLQNKYKEFSDADVDRKFNKQYGIPKEPVYDELKETEEEYNARHTEWKEKVAEIKADMLLDAKILKPELEKLKSELVLPDITTLKSNGQVQNQPTPEELEAEKKNKEAWVKAATDSATGFKGFSTTAKYKDGDKDVEIPVSYGLSNDEKKSLSLKLKTFAESNFDPYSLLKDRWVDESGNDKLDQVVKDLSWLFFGESAAQKFATEAANQRLEVYLREKKNIRVDNSGGRDFGAGEEKTESQKLQESFWGS